MFEGTEREVVIQETVFTRTGVDRDLRFAFELAQQAAQEAPHLGDQVQRHRHHHALLGRARRGDGEELPGGEGRQVHIDILTANFVPATRLVRRGVASNLFGDILSDLGPACTGTIGIAPSANINPDRKFLAVRAGARLGAGHRGFGASQPDRHDLVGADASSTRATCAGRRQRWRRRDAARRPEGAEDIATSAATAGTRGSRRGDRAAALTLSALRRRASGKLPMHRRAGARARKADRIGRRFQAHPGRGVGIGMAARLVGVSRRSARTLLTASCRRDGRQRLPPAAVAHFEAM